MVICLLTPPCCAASHYSTSYLVFLSAGAEMSQAGWAHLGTARADISAAVGVAGPSWQTEANRKLLNLLGASISVGARLPCLVVYVSGPGPDLCCTLTPGAPLILQHVARYPVHTSYCLFFLAVLCIALLASFPIMLQPNTFADGKLFSFGGITK